MKGSYFFNKRLITMAPMGFSSGLPLALTAGTLQAWLTVEGVDIKTIGLFTLVGIPYTLKFLWSPAMDRFVPGFLGRRRGWIFLCQATLALGIGLACLASPLKAPTLLAIMALFIAFGSASQDIVIDAYRTDVLRKRERGLGAAIFVTGYRTAMLISGALALIIADRIGFGNTYLFMAILMGLLLFSTMGGPEPENALSPPNNLQDAVIGPLKEFFLREKAIMFLFLVVIYKLTDAFAGTLTTAFLIRGVGFSPTDVGVVNKGLGLAATIGGALFGGSIMTRLRLFDALLIFGLFQGLSNLAFMALAWTGKSYPAMIAAVGFENLTGGMGTAAFVAFLMSLCNHRYSATQYALLSALAALGRVFVGPPSGFIVESVGWPIFFFITSLVAIPGLLLLFYMKKQVNGLDLRAEPSPDPG